MREHENKGARQQFRVGLQLGSEREMGLQSNAAKGPLAEQRPVDPMVDDEFVLSAEQACRRGEVPPRAEAPVALAPKHADLGVVPTQKYPAGNLSILDPHRAEMIVGFVRNRPMDIPGLGPVFEHAPGAKFQMGDS